MKAIEQIKSQLKDVGFNNDSLLVTSIEKAFNELQKENEELEGGLINSIQVFSALSNCESLTKGEKISMKGNVYAIKQLLNNKEI